MKKYLLALLLLAACATAPHVDTAQVHDCHLVNVEGSSAPWLCCLVEEFMMCKPVLPSKPKLHDENDREVPNAI